MKTILHYFFLPLFALTLSTPTHAASKAKSNSIPTVEITEASTEVKAQWDILRQFIQAWEAGNADGMRALMNRNIEKMVISAQLESQPAEEDDVDRDEAINRLLDQKDLLKDFELTKFLATRKLAYSEYHLMQMLFTIGKNEKGEERELTLALEVRSGKISSFNVFVGPVGLFESYSAPQLDVAQIKGVHLSSKNNAATKPQESEQEGTAAEPEGPICAWDGVDKDFTNHKLVQKARGRTIVFNVANQYIADYAEMRQDGAQRYDKLIGDKVYLLGRDATVSGEEFKEMISQGYLVWPQDTWPIRAGSQGSVVEFITKVESPGFEEPVFLKTIMIISDSHIEAIGETQCVKMEKGELSCRRLPEAEYEEMTQSGQMKSFLRQNVKP